MESYTYDSSYMITYMYVSGKLQVNMFVIAIINK